MAAAHAKTAAGKCRHEKTVIPATPFVSKFYLQGFILQSFPMTGEAESRLPDCAKHCETAVSDYETRKS
jgi:hypothetical protein